MADFTEEELSKALGDDTEVADSAIANDLQEEEEKEKQPENNPDGNDGADPAQENPDGDGSEQPENKDTKPDENADPDGADKVVDPEPEKPDEQEPELILGKFKNQDALVKAYQDLEKRFSEKSQEVKDVEKVNSDEFDNAVRQKIAEENWKLVDKAFETITDPNDAKEAQFLLSQFKKTGDGAYLEKARGYLDSRVDRRLEVDAMNMAAKITQTANAHRQEILLKPLAAELDKMAEEDPEFMNDTQNQDLMAMAIKLNPSTVDVRAVKKAIQDYSKTQYQKGYEAAKKEFAKQVEQKVVPIKSTTRVVQPAPKKNLDDLSIADQLKEEYKDIDLL